MISPSIIYADMLGAVSADEDLAEWLDEHSDDVIAAIEGVASAQQAPARRSADYADDIPLETARRAWTWSSHTPDRVAANFRDQYVETLRSARTQIDQAASAAIGESPTLEADIQRNADAAFDRYRDGLRARSLAYLGAVSRTASPHVTGPASFPVARNEKRMATEHKRSVELSEYRRKGLQRAIRALAPEAHEDVAASLRKRLASLEKLQEDYKAINVIVRKKVSNEEKVRQIMALGITEATAHKVLAPDFVGRVGIPPFRLTNNLAEIKRLQDRIKEEETRAAVQRAEYPFDGGKVIYSPEADRIQIDFDGKPSAEMINKLKRAAFKWAPSVGMWQRQLTDNAVYATRMLLDLHDLPLLWQLGKDRSGP